MNDNLFNPQDQGTFVDPDKDYFSELVGEDKKFKDEKALARAKYEADLTIERFKQDKDEMRKDILAFQEREKQRATLEELLQEIKNSKNSDTTSDTTKSAETVKPEEIKTLFKQAYEEEKKAEAEKRNFDLVQSKLRERFGSNFHNTLETQRETLGLSVDEVNALAKRSPEAFFRTFGLNQQQQQQDYTSPPRSQQRSDSFAPRSEQRTWSWWQNKKKENPGFYWDPKNVAQRHKDAQNLGSAFDDGDADMWDRLGNPLYSNQ